MTGPLVLVGEAWLNPWQVESVTTARFHTETDRRGAPTGSATEVRMRSGQIWQFPTLTVQDVADRLNGVSW